MHIGTRGWNSMAMRGWNSMAERIDMNWLEVFLLSNPSGNTNNISKPETPIVGYRINLRDYLTEKVKVGFSSSTRSSSTKSMFGIFLLREFPAQAQSKAFSACLLVVYGFIFVLWYYYFNTRKNRHT
ncbi:hypothetical protein SUGI_1121680 [Cryptomeria japonica]|nr:hypothetical protein SUGI_1121680 [Cryptomeria japonica]